MEKIDVIFISSLPDTDEFKPILEGLDANLLVNPSRGKIRAMLRENFDRPLIIFGHGTERGLLTTDWKGYLIDGKMVDMLRKRKSIIGCWCFAGNFADKYGLHGFFTSMFISNMDEALEFGFQTDAETISRENAAFAKTLGKLIADGTPMSEWVGILQGGCHKDIPFVRYNYEAMVYYE